MNPSVGPTRKPPVQIRQILSIPSKRDRTRSGWSRDHGRADHLPAMRECLCSAARRRGLSLPGLPGSPAPGTRWTRCGRTPDRASSRSREACCRVGRPRRRGRSPRAGSTAGAVVARGTTGRRGGAAPCGRRRGRPDLRLRRRRPSAGREGGAVAGARARARRGHNARSGGVRPLAQPGRPASGPGAANRSNGDRKARAGDRAHPPGDCARGGCRTGLRREQPAGLVARRDGSRFPGERTPATGESQPWAAGPAFAAGRRKRGGAWPFE
jgi:hypothetical protein